MFLQFSVSDDEGQYARPFAIEVKFFNIHGIILHDGLIEMTFDITHMDGESERFVSKCDPRPFGRSEIGPQKNIHTISMVGYPSEDCLNKQQLRDRIGRGWLIQKGGYFGPWETAADPK